MKYIENSPGMYVADLGELPHGGAFRAEISSPAVKAILAEEKATAVSTEFSVDPTTPLEQAELVPDRGLLQRMANLTGGVMTDPSHAERVVASFGCRPRPSRKATSTGSGTPGRCWCWRWWWPRANGSSGRKGAWHEQQR